MKQLGLALHNYHDTHKAFPPAAIGRCTAPDLNASGLPMLLPGLDQAPLYNQFNFSLTSSNQEGAGFESGTVGAHTSDPAVNGNLTPVTTRMEAFLCPSDSGRERTDGTSNTVMMGETTRTVRNGHATAWGYRVHVMVGIWLAENPINNWDWIGTRQPFGTLGSWARPGSMHVGGMHILMGDGAVRFISENIDAVTRQRLAYMADGQTIGEF